MNPEEPVVLKKLRQLDFLTVSEIKMGKLHAVTLEAEDEKAANDTVVKMAERLLANPVTEEFHIHKVVSR